MDNHACGENMAAPASGAGLRLVAALNATDCGGSASWGAACVLKAKRLAESWSPEMLLPPASEFRGGLLKYRWFFFVFIELGVQSGTQNSQRFHKRSLEERNRVCVERTGAEGGRCVRLHLPDSPRGLQGTK